MQKKLHCSGAIITELVSRLYQCYASCDTLRVFQLWLFYRYHRTYKNYQPIESVKYYFFLTKGNTSVYPAISVSKSIRKTRNAIINIVPRTPPAGS